MERAELLALAAREKEGHRPCRIRCCMAAGCLSANGGDVHKALVKVVQTADLKDEIEVTPVGCLSWCGAGPLVQVDPAGTMYRNVKPDDAASIVRAARAEGAATAAEVDRKHPFFTRQLPIVLENSGLINPERVEDYVAAEGYQGLFRAVLELTPAEVVQEVTTSGLRGRGGAGYPTGLKWATVAKMPGASKYVVCNGDEGDPGAFMDRSVMESDPHRVLEGMAIAGYAIGAAQGFVYVRAEYPLAVSRLRKAIDQAKKLGVLGTQIFGSPFDFRVDVRIGAGAVVCGEETALMASIEGRRGTPRPRPPYPAEAGLWAAPTLINNVETFANISPILRRGGAWYASIGTEKSKGTKVFSLTGKVRNTGLIEVPMGTPMRTIVEEMGGGVPDGTVKAVQTGGPSGGCVPADLLDTPVDYESLVKLGSIMGSGGMIVMDQGTNMVEVARFFMEFCMDESCGKCTPCRAGTVQMYRLLTRIVNRQATDADLTQLIGLCNMVRETSLCGLGQTAPNPVQSTLRYFEKEYRELLRRPVAGAGG
ncbi:MAG: NADH-quinone oxidoreductase subunit NuoF [Gemmataceae bacterium]|nr:NADH-quinone oxidoreductase subunit NuoF [Gemmataceae bacterium]